MRRFYQESWQGIPFTSFSHISFFHLAEPKFYAVFYEELFRRYKDWDDLPAQWRENKRKDARWLVGQLRAKLVQEPSGRTEPVRVLSIGSGVGYMENVLLDEMPDLELHVNEPSTVSMRWLRQRVPNERIYIGLPPACLPADVRYDMIYLSTVDYGIPTREFAHLLSELRAQLLPGGEIILLSLRFWKRIRSSAALSTPSRFSSGGLCIFWASGGSSSGAGGAPARNTAICSNRRAAPTCRTVGWKTALKPTGYAAARVFNT